MQPPASDTFRRPLGVFWDIENCSIPRGKSALAVCEKIRGEDFCRGHSEIQFAVVCDATKESPFVLDDLLKAQVGRGTRTYESYLTLDWLPNEYWPNLPNVISSSFRAVIVALKQAS